MTRQFCREKWGKIDHVFGKIRQCDTEPVQLICLLLKQKKYRYFLLQ